MVRNKHNTPGIITVLDDLIQETGEFMYAGA